MNQRSPILRAAKMLLGVEGVRHGLHVGVSDDLVGGMVVHAWRWSGDPERIEPIGDNLTITHKLLIASVSNAALLVEPIANWAAAVRAIVRADGMAKLAVAEVSLVSAKNEWAACKRRVDRSYE